MGPSAAWILSLWSSCTVVECASTWVTPFISLRSLTVFDFIAIHCSLPISPQNRLNVLGILTCGFTSIRTFLVVWMYTCSRPALFSGLSRSIMRLWWVMSGRAAEMSRPCFVSALLWSSQFKSSNFFPTYSRKVSNECYWWDNDCQRIGCTAMDQSHCYKLHYMGSSVRWNHDCWLVNMGIHEPLQAAKNQLVCSITTHGKVKCHKVRIQWNDYVVRHP